MCDKAVNTYPSTVKFVSECFMTQDRAVDRFISEDIFNSILPW